MQQRPEWSPSNPTSSEQRVSASARTRSWLQRQPLTSSWNRPSLMRIDFQECWQAAKRIWRGPRLRLQAAEQCSKQPRDSVQRSIPETSCIRQTFKRNRQRLSLPTSILDIRKSSRLRQGPLVSVTCKRDSWLRLGCSWSTSSTAMFGFRRIIRRHSSPTSGEVISPILRSILFLELSSTEKWLRLLPQADRSSLFFLLTTQQETSRKSSREFL